MTPTTARPQSSPTISKENENERNRLSLLVKEPHIDIVAEEALKVHLGRKSSDDVPSKQPPYSFVAQYPRPLVVRPLGGPSQAHPNEHRQAPPHGQTGVLSDHSSDRPLLNDLPIHGGFNMAAPFEQAGGTEASDSEESDIFSGVSSPGRAARRDLRSLQFSSPWSGVFPTISGALHDVSAPAGNPPAASYQYDAGNNSGLLPLDGQMSGGHSLSLTQNPGHAAAIQTLWARLYDRRRGTHNYRKKMSELRRKLVSLRSDKVKVDKDLQTLALTHSQSGHALPHKKAAKLVNKARELQDECTSVEAEYEEMSKKLDRREKQLEVSEAKFFLSLSGSADPAGQALPALTNALLLGTPALHPMQDGAMRIVERSSQNSRAPETPAISPTTDEFVLGIGRDLPIDVHPLYDLLLKASSALNESREDLEELVNERNSIVEDLRAHIMIRQSRGSPDYNIAGLDAALLGDPRSEEFLSVFAAYVENNDLEYLQKFNELEKEARDTVVAHERRFVSIREACVRESGFPKNLSYEDMLVIFGNEYRNVDNGTVEDISTRGSLSTGTPPTTSFPTLVTDPLIAVQQYPFPPKDALKRLYQRPSNDPVRQRLLDDYIKEYGIMTLVNRAVAGKKADFINRWILQSLRMSPMAAVQLYNISSGILGTFDVGKWQEDVVRFWAIDGTNVPDYQLYAPATELTSRTSSISGSSVEKSSVADE